MRLNQKKFAEWLRKQPPDKIVGKNRSPSCPIVQYYRDASGGREVIIYGRDADYFIDRGDGERKVPSWAADFICKIDGDQAGDIAARHALEVLTD